jgi:hypothetical protein
MRPLPIDPERETTRLDRGSHADRANTRLCYCRARLRSSNASATPRVATIFLSDLEHLAGERAEFIVTASEGFGIEPDTGRAVKGPAAGLSGLVIGVELGHQIGALPLESIPRLFAKLFEDVIEGRTGDDQAAGPATVA